MLEKLRLLIKNNFKIKILNKFSGKLLNEDIFKILKERQSWNTPYLEDDISILEIIEPKIFYKKKLLGKEVDILDLTHISNSRINDSAKEIGSVKLKNYFILKNKEELKSLHVEIQKELEKKPEKYYIYKYAWNNILALHNGDFSHRFLSLRKNLEIYDLEMTLKVENYIEVSLNIQHIKQLDLKFDYYITTKNNLDNLEKEIWKIIYHSRSLKNLIYKKEIEELKTFYSTLESKYFQDFYILKVPKNFYNIIFDLKQNDFKKLKLIGESIDKKTKYI
ncbi:MAG: hypothetical protein ACRC8M_09005 [Cetobacterium sp.]|uniref:hypothetical protein n=1 Tax=Cetobacterium sp. TaxID=2071632 RepID=UPI003F3EA9D8